MTSGLKLGLAIIKLYFPLFPHWSDIAECDIPFLLPFLILSFLNIIQLSNSPMFPKAHSTTSLWTKRSFRHTGAAWLWTFCLHFKALKTYLHTLILHVDKSRLCRWICRPGVQPSGAIKTSCVSIHTTTYHSCFNQPYALYAFSEAFNIKPNHNP